MGAFILFSLCIGCCSSVIFLELLINEDPGCGNLVTFFHFLFISIEGFINTTRFLSIPSKVPILEWVNLVVLYFIVNLMNNWSFNFNISMPLYMIFKSGSLAASMLTEKIVLQRKHSATKHISVLLISIGISIYTFASSTMEPMEKVNTQDTFINWMFGIAMLSTSLVLSARMGVYQEEIHNRFGRHPREALFYTHCLPLPGFFLISSDLEKHLRIILNSKPINLPGLTIQAPCMVIYLTCGVLSQFLCASSVFWMTSEFSALTVTLVLTLRKFLSIVISIVYFGNVFSNTHLIGAIMVFIGTLLFFDKSSYSVNLKRKIE